MSSETNIVGIDVNGLSGRYATALYDLADRDSALDAVAGDLRQLKQMMASSDELRRMIRSPVISRSNQSEALQVILAKSGASTLTINFIGVVASNRRLFAIFDIIKDYLKILFLLEFCIDNFLFPIRFLPLPFRNKKVYIL